jgi:hypothetical protein
MEDGTGRAVSLLEELVIGDLGSAVDGPIKRH